MVTKKSNGRVKLRLMRSITLQEKLEQARDGRSYSEMGRRCELSAMTIQRIETGAVELPSRSTLEALARGYRLDLDDLALAAYGRLFEEVPEGSDDTAESDLEVGSPADIIGGEWHPPGRQLKPASVAIS